MADISPDSEFSKLETLIKHYVRQEVSKLYTMMPGRVEAFDDATQRIDVQPLFRKEWAGDSPPEDLPVLTGVQVLYPQGIGTSATFKVKKGSFVMLMCSMRSLERFDSTEWASGTIDPGDTRNYDISDAIAIAGLKSAGKGIEGFDPDAYQIKHGATEIKMNEATGDISFIPGDGKIHMGDENASEQAILGNKFNGELQTLMNALVAAAPTLVATGVGPGVMNPTLLAAINTFLAQFATWLATKTQVT